MVCNFYNIPLSLFKFWSKRLGKYFEPIAKSNMYPLWHLSLLLFLVARVFAFVEFAPSCNNHDDVRDALQSVVDHAQTASQFQYLPAAQRPPAGQAPPANQRASALFDDLFDGANSGAQDRLNFIISPCCVLSLRLPWIHGRC